MTVRPDIEAIYDPPSGSVQYVVSDPATRRCAIIDPVLDYDEKSGSTATVNADRLLEHVAGHGLEVEWILDTHPHADHFSAAAYLAARTGAPTAIGRAVIGVQKLWQEIYNLPSLRIDGSQWDRLFDDGERFAIGDLPVEVIHSPGHTLASVTYLIGDCAFIHDTLFFPDSGTARCDFPGGSAEALWQSIQRILTLPDETRLWTGHDYCAGGREPRWESTVAIQKRENVHLAGRSQGDFIAMRQDRDRTLPIPRLMLHALQVNLNGGRLPEPEANGIRYLKLPIDALGTRAWA